MLYKRYCTQVLCSNSNQGMVSLLNSSALRLAVEAIHMYGGDVEVVSSGCGVMDVLTEAGELVGLCFWC